MSKEKVNAQYPGFFKGKRVHVKSVDGEITRGNLVEIQEYSGKKLLIVEMSADVNRMVNFDHVTFIEEI